MSGGTENSIFRTASGGGSAGRKIRTVIIGGGPAGLFAAIAAAETGTSDVILLEKNGEPGRKLRMTGGGRCNLTNNKDVRDFSRGVLQGAKFLTKALYALDPEAICRWFEENGVPLISQEEDRVFPRSDRADEVLQTLISRAKALGVVFRLRVAVLGIDALPTGAFRVRMEGETIECDSCVLCTGGLSYPTTGSTGDGLRIAGALGQPLVVTRPGLAPIRLREQEVGSSYDARKNSQPGRSTAVPSGIALRDIGLVLYEGDTVLSRTRGDLLFTHTGVSGPAVLTISRDLPTESAAYSGGDVRLRIDLLPSLKESERDEKILHLISEFPNRSLLRVLRGLAPEAYLRNLLDRIGLEADRACHDIRREERKLLRDAIHGLRFTVAEPPSYKEAMITAGGVDTAFVDPRTMESKCIPGLFFAGEILDIDAITGGYNLQIAFSTGYLAGRAAVRI